jgi:plastocyanin
MVTGRKSRAEIGLAPPLSKVGMALLSALLLALGRQAAARARPTPSAESCNSWIGEELPLPLTVKTPQDIAFKAAVERQYLIFNLMAGGRLAFQRGDYAVAIGKWEALLKTPGLDGQIERAVAPVLDEARRRATRPAASAGAAAAGGKPGAPHLASAGAPASAATPAALVTTPEPEAPPPPPRPADSRTSVSGTVVGGGDAGPGSAVVWLKRLDGRPPAVAPATGRFITQRDKTFLPHVLAVPVGTKVEFRNEDRIYHNVFSLNRPNDFDAGIRAAGTTYTRSFDAPGPVEILCNIHSTMNAYVVVVDSPFYTKTRPTGAFTLHGIPPGTYELAVWHEAATAIARKKITVGADGVTGLSIAVDADKRAAPFVPDKYGHKRQPHLGY